MKRPQHRKAMTEVGGSMGKLLEAHGFNVRQELAYVLGIWSLEWSRSAGWKEDVIALVYPTSRKALMPTVAVEVVTDDMRIELDRMTLRYLAEPPLAYYEFNPEDATEPLVQRIGQDIELVGLRWFDEVASKPADAWRHLQRTDRNGVHPGERRYDLLSRRLRELTDT